MDTPFLSKDIVSTLSKPDIVAEVHIYHKDILASLSIDYFKNWYKEQTKSITEFEAINPMSRLAFHSFRKKVRRIAILYKYLYLVTNEPVYEYYFGSLITEVDLLGKFHDDALQDDRQEIVLNYNFDIIKDLIRKLHN